MLDDRGGDIWSFRTEVHGSIDGLCSQVTVTADDRPMATSAGVQRFTAGVSLHSGDNVVTASCWRDRTIVASSRVVYHVPLEPRPVARIRALAEGNRVVLDADESERADGSASPIVRREWLARDDNPAPLGFLAGTDAARLAIEIPTRDGEYYVSLEVVDADGHRDRSTTYFVVERGSFRIPDAAREHAAWIDDAVVYGVVPYFLGNDGLVTVRAELDRLRDLGVDALWLSPLTAAAPDDEYGYAVRDHFKLRSAYGDEGSLRALVRAAHERRMRVVLDFVPNHTSVEHPYFRDAERYGKRSRYFDFYSRDDAGRPRHYFDWAHLPNLDYGRPEVRRWMKTAFSHWVREYDVDGFRVDAAWGVEERTPSFWSELRRDLKRIKPDLWLLAEASAKDPSIYDGRFDTAYDWTLEPGHWAWEAAFANTAIDTAALRSALFTSRTPPLTLRYLNNNDTGDRFVTRHGLERLPPATMLLMTLPGIPALFEGDETATEFRPYDQVEPLARVERPALREMHRQLIALRHARPALRRGALVPVESSSAGVVAYVRALEGERPLLVAINFSGAASRAVLTLPADQQGALEGKLRDALASDAPAARAHGGRAVVELPPFAGRVLEPSVNSNSRFR